MKAPLDFILHATSQQLDIRDAALCTVLGTALYLDNTKFAGIFLICWGITSTVKVILGLRSC
jgi:hypothetical protein